MDWTLIGYFPKRRALRSGWVSPYPEHPDAGFPAPASVDEICSVSDCIARGPDLMTGDINPMGGYGSLEAAWQAVPVDRQGDFCLFAYRVAPVRFRDGQEEPLELPSLDIDPIPSSFTLLGYDAVELSDGPCLGCSPLSCNGQAARTVVNRHCLMSTEAQGMALAREYSITQPEPGPYGVVEVWRKPGADTGSIALPGVIPQP